VSAFRIALILTYAAFSLAPHRASAAAEKAESVQASLAKLGQGIDDASLLTDAGSTIQWRDLVGQPRALFFGFTNCPSVCPVTVWELDTAMAEIGPSAADLKIIFVTLDPARDTPAALKKYFSGFKGRVIPLSGQEPEIQRVAKSFEVTSEKVDSGNGNYTLDHTGAVYLLDKQGGVVDTLAFGTPRDVTLARLKKLLAASK
jgi:protein SCO1